MLKSCMFFLLWLVAVGEVGAFQTPLAGRQEYLVRHYDIEDGLPVNSVNGMVQDDAGYLYISTYDGLVRYDGYDFKTYNSGNTPGMGTNRIGGIIKSDDNTIWLFNEDGTITRKTGEIFKTYHRPDIPGRANWMVEGKDDRIWVTGSEGMAYFDKESNAFVPLEDPIYQSNTAVAGVGLNGEVYAVNRETGLVSWHDGVPSVLLNRSDFPSLYRDVREIRQFRKNVLWLVGSHLLMRFDMASHTMDIVDTEGLGNTAFWNIHKKKDGNFVLAANTGFFTLNAQTLTLKKRLVPVNSKLPRVHIIYEENDGKSILIGDDEVIIDGQTVLRAPSIKFGFLDREGSLWVGSETDGLYQIRKSSFINLTQDKMPSLSNSYSIAQDQNGSIWTCSLTLGISKISGINSQNWNTANSSLDVNGCKFLFEDTDGTIYAGFTNSTIWAFSKGNWTPFLPSDEKEATMLSVPEAMYRTGDRLLIGHRQSLLVAEHGKLRFFDDTRPPELSGVQVFRENSRGVIFVGTSRHGITRIAGNSLTNYSTQDGVLKSDIIRDIFLQSDDTLWVATENLGLNRLILDENGKVRSSVSITAADGMTHNSLHRIIKDKYGSLWISSNGGIMRIAQKALNDFADGSLGSLPVLSFDEKDGMINREANGGVQSAGLLTSEEHIWFPNQKGITILNPDDFTGKRDVKTPEPIIETIAFSDSIVHLNNRQRLTLPKSERNLRVKFSAPNFAYQDRVGFRYKMEGVNMSWQQANQSREAVLTTISPGEHEFKIQAQLLGGALLEKSIMVVVPPYFYETGWFMLVLVLLGMGIITGLYKIRVSSLREREKKLQKRVDAQTKELKEAAEQKSRFFTGITHELKTPLSLIVGPLDDLAEESEKPLPHVLQNQLSLMQRNSHRLKNLVEQILDVSKLNADAVHLTLQPVELEKITRQIVGQFQSRLEQEKISLELSAAPIDKPIYIDRDAWERILINLLTNAIRFSPKGSTIYIGIRNEANGVVLSIRDEGEGIAKEHHQKVFEYLYQTEGKRSSGGTGIGLFLVKGLVEHMGGTIRLASEKGQGAEFVITLQKGYGHFDSVHTLLHDPRVDDTVAYPALESVSPVITRSPTADHEFDAKLLVVEDNHDFRDYLQSVLGTRYQILLASNGNEALKILADEHPALIISDIMMPGMNGLEFVHSLRQKKPFKHLPVIFLSAKNRDADIEAGLSTGADIYLKKPIRSNLLLTQIAAVLRREKILFNESITKKKQQEPEFKRKVRQVVYRQMGNSSLTVNKLADALYISRAKLYMEWKKVSDVTVNDFIKQVRLNEAKILLTQKGFNVQETARAVGFSDANYFSTRFKKEFGMPPSKTDEIK